MKQRVYAVGAILLIWTILLTSPSPTTSAPPPIQDQGSSPYCLFAVHAYLTHSDMWRLEAEYHRRQLPTWDGVIPHTAPLMRLASELYGADWHTWPQGDWWGARWGVEQGHPTIYSGRGHAIIVLDFDQGLVRFLDSLHSEQVQEMREEELAAWWDGWAWFNRRY